MARVSVIVPVFNEERTLDEVIRRIRATGAVHEIVAVDDGSTDRSPQILASLSESASPAIVVVRHEVNSGKGAAVRTGFARVTGDIDFKSNTNGLANGVDLGGDLLETTYWGLMKPSFSESMKIGTGLYQVVGKLVP